MLKLLLRLCMLISKFIFKKWFSTFLFYKTKKVIHMDNLTFILAVWTGLEPATSAVTGRHSNQLNYRRTKNYTRNASAKEV